MIKNYAKPTPPIAQLDNVPGPEADATVLSAHYRRIQDVIACRRYEDVKRACGWCLTDWQEVRPIGTRGEPATFCTKRCAEAHDAYRVKVLHRGQKIEEIPDLAAAIEERNKAKREEGHERRQSYGSGQTRT